MDAIPGMAGRAATAGRAAGRAGDPLALAERRLHWLDSRQSVLAQNVANADTPGFRPRDLTPFQRELASAMRLAMARTAPAHAAGGQAAALGARTERGAEDVVPDGNAV